MTDLEKIIKIIDRSITIIENLITPLKLKNDDPEIEIGCSELKDLEGLQITLKKLKCIQPVLKDLEGLQITLENLNFIDPLIDIPNNNDITTAMKYIDFVLDVLTHPSINILENAVLLVDMIKNLRSASKELNIIYDRQNGH